MFDILIYMTISNNILFNNLEEKDLVLLHKWLNNPHVHQWYDKDKHCTLEDIEKRYLPKITGEKPTQAYIIYYDSKPIGYIQTYKINDYPEYSKYVGANSNTAGLDLFIGESDYIGKGLGSEIIKSFLGQSVFTSDDINRCIVGPEPNNIRAIEAYKEAGFNHFKTVKLPDEAEPEYLMELTKSAYNKF